MRFLLCALLGPAMVGMGDDTYTYPYGWVDGFVRGIIVGAGLAILT